jgi:hypothetical protein
VTPTQEAERVVAAILHDLRDGPHRGVVVDSPPGAGKSTLVVRAAAELVANHDQVMIVAQTNEQVDDLIGNLSRRLPYAKIGRLSATDYLGSSRIMGLANVFVETAAEKLSDCSVLIGTAAKWAYTTQGHWHWAIVDEAYQMRSDMLLRIAPRFERGLFVGDPGQLDPFSTVEVERWLGLSWDPMQSAVAVLLRHNPDLPLHRLPVSWRLPATAAPVVSQAFYPFSPFVSGTGADERRLRFASQGIGMKHLDGVLDTAAQAGWALYELPSRQTLRTDGEAIDACAALAERLVQRQAIAEAPDREPGGELVRPARIAIGTAHRDQAAAIRTRLRDTLPGVTVDTANRLQGREYDVTIVLHPLSGRRDATAFHLESGRLCVLTSRHRHACIVVAREGIQELLDAHPSAEPVHINVPVKFPDGWEANQSILTHLKGTR